MRLMPKIIQVDAAALEIRWMHSTLRLIETEAWALGTGGETVITRLADVLVVQADRSWIDSDPAAPGRLAGSARCMTHRSARRSCSSTVVQHEPGPSRRLPARW